MTLESRLQAAGLRATPKRIAIGGLLFDGKDRHVTADDVAIMARQGGVRVSLATVYNTLNLFLEKKLIREVIVDPSKVFYDPNTHPHHHFYDVATGRLMDIDAAEVTLGGLPALPAGMAMEGVEIIVRIRPREAVREG